MTFLVAQRELENHWKFLICFVFFHILVHHPGLGMIFQDRRMIILKTGIILVLGTCLHPIPSDLVWGWVGGGPISKGSGAPAGPFPIPVHNPYRYDHPAGDKESIVEVISFDRLSRLFVGVNSWDYLLTSVVDSSCCDQLLNWWVRISLEISSCECLLRPAFETICCDQLLRLSVEISCWD